MSSTVRDKPVPVPRSAVREAVGRTSIKALSDQQLRQWFSDLGHPTWRMEQLKHWLYQTGVMDFAAMGNLPKSLRQALSRQFSCFSLVCRQELLARDNTRKFLLELADGLAVETVLIPTGARRTVCVSSQVGCPVGCAFCATGRLGLARNLQAEEILDQIIFCAGRTDRKISNLVVMGMGEPLLNFNSTVTALDWACAPDRLDLAARQVTVSTTGIPGGIIDLADLQRPWNLAWSLHAPDDRRRARLIPPAYRFTIRENLEACRYYRQKTGRKVTLEYLLLNEFNDRDQDALKVAGLARAIDAKVNLICYNPTSGNHAAAPAGMVRRFSELLAQRGVAVAVRQSRGRDIQAACGQLRAETRDEKAAESAAQPE